MEQTIDDKMIFVMDIGQQTKTRVKVDYFIDYGGKRGCAVIGNDLYSLSKEGCYTLVKKNFMILDELRRRDATPNKDS